MRVFIRSLAVLVALCVALPAVADDQQKATKELNKVTAMASDPIGRTVVNLTLAETFSVKRPDLVLERRDTGLNYGSVFVEYELIAAGAKKEDIAAKVKAGKDIFQIAGEHQANWKQILDDAKKLNGKIDENLYTYLEDRKKATARDQADGYLLNLDGVTADNQVSQGELSQAEDRYVRVKDRAEEASRRANRLSTADQQAAYRDNARSAGPQGGGASGGGPSGGAEPSAGGPR